MAWFKLILLAGALVSYCIAMVFKNQTNDFNFWAFLAFKEPTQ